MDYRDMNFKQKRLYNILFAIVTECETILDDMRDLVTLRPSKKVYNQWRRLLYRYEVINSRKSNILRAYHDCFWTVWSETLMPANNANEWKYSDLYRYFEYEK